MKYPGLCAITWPMDMTHGTNKSLVHLSRTPSTKVGVVPFGGMTLCGKRIRYTAIRVNHPAKSEICENCRMHVKASKPSVKGLGAQKGTHSWTHEEIAVETALFLRNGGKIEQLVAAPDMRRVEAMLGGLAE